MLFPGRTAAASRESRKSQRHACGSVSNEHRGFNLLSMSGPVTSAFYFVTLEPWSDRKTRAEQYQEIKARLNQQSASFRKGLFFSFSPPHPWSRHLRRIQFVLEDRAGRDVQF